MSEALHGFMANGSTSFPQVLGLASTFDPALVRRVFTAAGDEARSAASLRSSLRFSISPAIRAGPHRRDLRRRPVPVSRMAVAAITGLQGDDFHIDNHHVMAHRQALRRTRPARGRHQRRARQLLRTHHRENFLIPSKPPSRRRTWEASWLPYNEIDGIPSHINHWLLGRVAAPGSGASAVISLRMANGLQMLSRPTTWRPTCPKAARLGAGHGSRFRSLRRIPSIAP